MIEKRFFILTDDEYNTRPFIRDRKKEIHDIYGDYKYDDLNEICERGNNEQQIEYHICKDWRGL